MWKLLILLSVISLSCKSNALPSWNKYQHYLEVPAVVRFREYLQIDTSKEENLIYAVQFWIRQATELGIPYVVYQPDGLPVIVITLVGTDPTLPSIMLNSHMDVVKVDEREWKYPPFEAVMDEIGDIYARGSQDTKDVGIQYFEAIRRLKKENITLTRTLHVTIVPDEERGGKRGMKAFVKTKEFKALNVGFALDEGVASSEDFLLVTFVDKRAWQMQFVISGVGGHGSFMPEGSAMDNAYKFMRAVMAYRETQKNIQKTKSITDAAGYTSLNINVLNGGLATNIIPSEIMIEVDMRLSTDADPAAVQSIVDSWMQAAGNNTKVTYYRRETQAGITPVDDSNPYWKTMENTLRSLGVKYTPIVLPATSDMLVLRNLGIPAIGFTTKTNTILRAHNKDEYQNVEVFLKGIDIYTQIIKNLGNVPSKVSEIVQQLNNNKSKG